MLTAVIAVYGERIEKIQPDCVGHCANCGAPVECFCRRDRHDDKPCLCHECTGLVLKSGDDAPHCPIQNIEFLLGAAQAYWQEIGWIKPKQRARRKAKTA